MSLLSYRNRLFKSVTLDEHINETWPFIFFIRGGEIFGILIEFIRKFYVGMEVIKLGALKSKCSINKAKASIKDTTKIASTLSASSFSNFNNLY